MIRLHPSSHLTAPPFPSPTLFRSLRVDQADRFVDRDELVGRDADVGQCKELQHPILVAPHCPQLVTCPRPLDRRDDLVIAGAFERPAMCTEIMLEHVNRRREGRCLFLIVSDQANLLVQQRLPKKPAALRQMMQAKAAFTHKKRWMK